jgi:NAD(P)-dependent dehydrogenase (short-subunit alcohol dehydrogenase family)
MSKPLAERVYLITGATDGIGLGTATRLASLGATVLLHGRDSARLTSALDTIARETGSSKLETYRADFAELDEVCALADAVAAQHQTLDVLINNAGIGRGARDAQERELSADGHELRFQVNHLAPFLLTHLLLPRLEHAGAARIVNVASAAQTPIDFDDVMLTRDYSGQRAYAQSKLAMVMATFELAARLDANIVTVNALHPGSLLDTKMVREGFGAAQGPVETGIVSETHLATSPDLDGVTGAYFDRTQPDRADAQAYRATDRERLWALSEELVGID